MEREQPEGCAVLSERLSSNSKLLLLAFLVCPLTTPLLAGAAERPNQPPYFAICNARIVPVSGPVIEQGTVVVANGVIAAVGREVSVPPEAWVIDGSGLTVYPGLIDSLTNLGLQAEEDAQGGNAGQAGAQRRQPISHGPEDRPASTPWENAADNLNLEDKRLENWRKAGFTTAVTAPDKGILAGQAALINLAAERPNQMVVKTPVALRINFATSGSFWSFPNSLMGVLAYIRQAFLDAEQYSQAQAIYERRPQGLERPAYDRVLEPLRQAVEQDWPVLLPAEWSKEISRALWLSEEIRVNPLLYGAHQGHAAAAVLAQKRVPVLVSVKWPEKAPDADPDAEEPLRVLRFRDRAPSTPAALHEAGVRFAFYSDGLSNPKEILKNARKAIEAGLPTDAALRAFTLSPAEIFGVADRLGSVETGKIANLVVTDGGLFEEKTKVKMVFIDGRKYEVREPGRPQEPPAVNLTGKWELTVNTDQGPQERTAELQMAEDGTLTGTITTSRGTSSLSSGWVSGTKFNFTILVTAGTRSFEVTYAGSVEGNKMTGTARVGRRSAEFTGHRPEGAAENAPAKGGRP